MTRRSRWGCAEIDSDLINDKTILNEQGDITVGLTDGPYKCLACDEIITKEKLLDDQHQCEPSKVGLTKMKRLRQLIKEMDGTNEQKALAGMLISETSEQFRRYNLIPRMANKLASRINLSISKRFRDKYTKFKRSKEVKSKKQERREEQEQLLRLEEINLSKRTEE